MPSGRGRASRASHLQHAFAYFNLGPGSSPFAESVANRMLSLSVSPEMLLNHIDRAVTVLTEI